MPVPKSTVTQFAFPTLATVLLAPNQERKAAAIYNATTTPVILKMGAAITTASFTVPLVSGAYFELQLPVSAGQVEALALGVGVGNLYVTEFTEGF